MKIEQMVLGMFGTNCYIVSGEKEGAAILIDPADRPKRIISYLEANNLTPEAVVLTHGHYDHFLAVPALQSRWPELPVYCHPLDCPEEKEEYDMGQMFPTVTAFANVKPLAEGQELSLAGLEIKVLHTPGHTPGSVILIVDDIIFSGDTLFHGSIGRTDFAGGNAKQMMESLDRIAAIEGNYKVLPGHEGATELDYERKYNPYLRKLFKIK